jgi:release factor family 3
MDSLIDDYAAGIFGAQEPPCLSLYQPTHRHHPDNQQDPIRFGNLVKALEESLRQKYSTRDVQPLLEPFQRLAGDRDFWNHTLDGLAVLGAPGLFRVYRLQRPVPELAIVADSFHLKPLLRILQSADGYSVLGLSRERITLFEGNRDVLDEVELPSAVPQTSSDVLGEDSKVDRPSTWTPIAGGEGVRYGKGSKSDLEDNDTERFFRAVDRAILEHYSRPSGLPLLLAALPEHISFFRRISNNPFLMEEGIDVHPGALTIEALRDHAWRVIEPHYLARLAALVEMFEASRAQELGDHDLAQVARSTVAGRVSTLLIEADRHVPGRIDAATGRIAFDDLVHPEVDDLLDDLGELVLKHGGQAVIVPAERMPTRTGIAAIYRF